MRSKLGDLIVDNIRFMRVQKKLTQKQLEKKLGVSKNYIQLIENYRFYPKFSMVERIAEVLEVNPFDLLTYDFRDKEMKKWSVN